MHIDALTWRYTVVSPKVGCHGITCWRSVFSLHQIRVAIVGYPSMFWQTCAYMFAFHTEASESSFVLSTPPTKKQGKRNPAQRLVVFSVVAIPNQNRGLHLSSSSLALAGRHCSEGQIIIQKPSLSTATEQPWFQLVEVNKISVKHQITVIHLCNPTEGVPSSVLGPFWFSGLATKPRDWNPTGTAIGNCWGAACNKLAASLWLMNNPDADMFRSCCS